MDRNLVAVLESLGSSDRNERVSAVKELGVIDDQQALEVLVETLNDKSEEVRAASVEALARRGGPQALGALMDCLDDSSPVIRAAAMEAVVSRRDEVSGMLESLKGSPRVARRLLAVKICMEQEDSFSHTYLVDSLWDLSPEVRTMAREAVMALSAEKVRDILVGKIMAQSEGAGRAEAILQALQGDQEGLFSAAVLSVADSNWRVRAAAVSLLGRLGRKDGLDSLALASRDDNAAVRYYAKKALAAFGVTDMDSLAPVSAPPIAPIAPMAPPIAAAPVSAPVQSVPQTAAPAQPQEPKAGKPEIVQPLPSKPEPVAAETPSQPPAAPQKPTVVTEVHKVEAPRDLFAEIMSTGADKDRLKALADLPAQELGQRFDLLAQAVRNDKSEVVRAIAVRKLAGLRDGRVVELMSGALGDRDFRVRANAIETLEAQGDEAAREILLPLLSDEDNRIAANAAKALHSLGDSKVIHRVLSMLHEGETWMRDSAAYILGEIGDSSITRDVVEALAREEEQDVVIKLLVFLGKFGNEGAILPLLQIADSTQGIVLNVAEQAVQSVAQRFPSEYESARQMAEAVKAGPQQEEAVQDSSDSEEGLDLIDLVDESELFSETIEETVDLSALETQPETSELPDMDAIFDEGGLDFSEDSTSDLSMELDMPMDMSMDIPLEEPEIEPAVQDDQISLDLSVETAGDDLVLELAAEDDPFADADLIAQDLTLDLDPAAAPVLPEPEALVTESLSEEPLQSDDLMDLELDFDDPLELDNEPIQELSAGDDSSMQIGLSTEGFDLDSADLGGDDFADFGELDFTTGEDAPIVMETPAQEPLALQEASLPVEDSLSMDDLSLDLDNDLVDLNFVEPDDMPPLATSAKEEEIKARVKPQGTPEIEELTLDFPQAAAPEAQESMGLQDFGEDDLSNMDLELNFDLGDDAPAPVEEPSSAASDPSDELDMDFLTLENLSEEPAPVAAAAPAAVSGPGLDPNLDLDNFSDMIDGLFSDDLENDQLSASSAPAPTAPVSSDGDTDLDDLQKMLDETLS